MAERDWCVDGNWIGPRKSRSNKAPEFVHSGQSDGSVRMFARGCSTSSSRGSRCREAHPWSTVRPRRKRGRCTPATCRTVSRTRSRNERARCRSQLKHPRFTAVVDLKSKALIGRQRPQRSCGRCANSKRRFATRWFPLSVCCSRFSRLTASRSFHGASSARRPSTAPARAKSGSSHAGFRRS